MFLILVCNICAFQCGCFHGFRIIISFEISADNKETRAKQI